MSKKAKATKKNSKEQSTEMPWATLETKGFLLVAMAIALLLSLISFATDPDSRNLLGLMGFTVGWASHALFGLNSYLIVLWMGWLGFRYLFSKPVPYLNLRTAYFCVILISSAFLLSLAEIDAPSLSRFLNQTFYPGRAAKKLHYHLGGAPFYFIVRDLPIFNLHHILNTVGIILLFSSTLIASVIYLCNISILNICRSLKQKILKEKQESAELQIPPAKPAEEAKKEQPKQESATSDFLRFVKLRMPSFVTDNAQKLANTPQQLDPNLLAIQPEKDLKVRPSISRKEQADGHEDLPAPKPKRMELETDGKEAFKRPSEVDTKARVRETALAAQRVHNGDFSDYVLPPLTLLTNPKKIDQTSLKKDLKRQAEVLEETLLSFGIEAKVGQINCGPTITSFEVHPAIGVKVQKIKTLDNDIALNMEAKSIRIIAPIPGKAAVGIEVPNPQPQEVGFKDMLLHYQQMGQKFHIPILLGKAVNGDYVMSDLAKMPHCIIAGATGSGKSVCINTIIMSIILTAKPDQIKLIMVDPKKVELTPYSALPHMLAPVITEPQGAAAALNWLVKEMETRYEILKLVGVRNIDAFNKRTINEEHENSLNREIPQSLPYMVGIIDELADLMMVASQDIETPIARIAQMARAVGIHLILATQRPSREVITGLIKANFPTRISFKVASRVNSQIVLDEVGAESLLGNGDMLFLPPGSSHLIRAQGAFIRDEDILATIQNICQQAPPRYLIQSFDQMIVEGGGGEAADSDLDSLYEQAKDVVLSTGNASTTFLQRKLKVGYARAASLMDQLERNGIVGPAEGAKPRKIYARKHGSNEDEFDDQG